MTAADFNVSEGRLAEAMGVPRKALRPVRADVLTQGVDWEYVEGGAVHYSRAGIERTLAHLGLPSEKIAALLPPSPAAPEAPAVPPAPAEEASPAPALDLEIVDSPPNDEQAAADFQTLGAMLAMAAGATPSAPAEEEPLALEAPEVVEVRVTRCYAHNRRLVAGELDGKAVRVRVRTNGKLRPGMVLRCALVEADLYTLTERLPRWPGKR